MCIVIEMWEFPLRCGLNREIELCELVLARCAMDV